MTLVYRAIWQDDRTDLGEAALAAFSAWVAERSDEQIEISGRGQYSADPGVHLGPHIDVSVEYVTSDDGRIDVAQLSYISTTPGGRRWHTLLRMWFAADGGGWCWVDNSVSGNDLDPRSLDVIAPEVARWLINAGQNPRVGDIDLSYGARHYEGEEGAEELAELITHFERTIPVVVFARSAERFREFGGRSRYQLIIASTARSLAGIAVVAVAEEPVTNRLTELFGPEFGVSDGAFRVYANGTDPAMIANAFRHRYVTADRYLGERDRAARIAGRIVGPESTLRRPPDSWSDAAQRLVDERSEMGIARSLAAEQDELIESLTRQVKDLEKETVGLLEWQREFLRLAEHLDHAKKLLITNGVCEDFDDGPAGGFVDKPPRTAEEAVALSEKYLSDYVEIHPKALREPKTMNRDNGGQDFARDAWQGFKTLYAYAKYRDRDPQCTADILTWCESTENGTGWPAEKIARSESRTTMNEQKHKKSAVRARCFEVSIEVNPSGMEEMRAHLKVRLKGGRNIPRIYFLYSEATKKVHVGFYGPHGLVPNTKS